jgi:NADPH:quinone reductase-like Zn-dependent oxidoreductase
VAVSGHPLRTLWVALAGGRRSTAFISRPNREDLEHIQQLLEDGRIRPLVDRALPLADAAEALRYHGGGAATGKVVLTLTGAAARSGA